MRKGMKLLAAIVAATMLSAMSMTAFGLTYSTETNYSGDTVTVTTTVTEGMAENEEVAYLVYSGTDANKDTIKYIDQKNQSEAVNGILTFTWTDAASTIVEGTKAYVGTTSTAAGAGEELELPVLDFVVTYSSSGNGYVCTTLSADATDVSDGGTATTNGDVTFYIFPNAGYKFNNVTNATTGAVISHTETSDGNAVTVTFTEAVSVKFNFIAEATAANITAVASGTNSITDAKAIVFAKATGAVEEAGMVVALDDAKATELNGIKTGVSVDLPAGLYVFPALMVGTDGSYAVEVNNEGVKSTGAARAYIKVGGKYILK